MMHEVFSMLLLTIMQFEMLSQKLKKKTLLQTLVGTFMGIIFYNFVVIEALREFLYYIIKPLSSTTTTISPFFLQITTRDCQFQIKNRKEFSDDEPLFSKKTDISGVASSFTQSSILPKQLKMRLIYFFLHFIHLKNGF